MAKIVSKNKLENLSGGLSVKWMRDSEFNSNFVILGSEDEVDKWKEHAIEKGWKTKVGIYPGLHGQCVLYETNDVNDARRKLRDFSGFN